MPSEAKIVVIVLNWNGLEDTLRCLQSLCRQRARENAARVIVIDNGSTADPATAICQSFPDIDYVRLEKNIGYAAACNAGAKRALADGAEFILFLNNDAIVEPETLPRLIQSFELEPKLGLVSAVIRTQDQVSRVEFAGGFLNFAIGKFQPRRFIPRQSNSLSRCDYASGCCLLISSKIINDVGLFDETFFAYFEDTDLSIRARKRGFKVACRLDTSVYHKGSAATRAGISEGTTSPLKHYLVARNRIRLLRKHAPLLARIIFFAVIQPFSIAYYLIGFLIRGRFRKACAFIDGIRAGFGSLSAMPMIDKWL